VSPGKWRATETDEEGGGIPPTAHEESAEGIVPARERREGPNGPLLARG